MSAELTGLSIADASRLLHAGQLGAVELTEAHLARIAARDPHLNAYLTVTADRALRDATRADDALASGSTPGPLTGIPIGLKDVFATEGIRTTAGSRVLADHVPAADSTVARRIRYAGAVLLGKHSTHEFAWGGTNANHHFGPTRNPHDPERIPGGSSGGSACAVADGMAMGAIGTDTCGSVRIPAALSGCVGLKPSYGRVGLTGAIRQAPSLDHAGPLARSVRDVALLLQAVAGFDANDPASRDEPVPDWPAGLTGDVRGLRVGRAVGEALEPEVAAAFDVAVATLRDLGCTVVDVQLPDPGPLDALVGDLVRAEADDLHRETFAARPGDYGPQVAGFLRMPPVPAGRLAEIRRELRAAAETLPALLRGLDALVTATVPLRAPRIGVLDVDVGGLALDVESALTRATMLVNVVGLPALSVPCAPAPDGLPIGLQIIGRPWDEATVLRVGDAYEQARVT